MAKTRKRAGPKSSKKAEKEKSDDSNEELNQEEKVADEPNVSSPPPSDTGKDTAEAPEKTAASDEKESESDVEGSGGPKILNELDGTLVDAPPEEQPVPETEPVKPVLRLVPLMMLLKPEVLDKPAKSTPEIKSRKSNARPRKSTSYIEISSSSSTEAEQISVSSSSDDEDARRKSRKSRNGGSSKENNSTNSKLSNGASKKTKDVPKDISVNLEKMPANVNRLMKTFKVDQERIESWSDTDDFENMISTSKIDRNAPAKMKEAPNPVETTKQAEPVVQKSRSSKKVKKESDEDDSEASVEKKNFPDRRKRPERNSARNARIKTKTVIESDEKQTSSDSDEEEDDKPLKPARNAKKPDPHSDTRGARRGRKALVKSDPDSDTPEEKVKDDKKSSKSKKKLGESSEASSSDDKKGKKKKQKKTDDDHAKEKTKKCKREKSTSSEEEEVVPRGRTKKTKETQQPSRTTRTRRGVATTPERSSPRKSKTDLKITISLKKKVSLADSSEDTSEEKEKSDSSARDDDRIVQPVNYRDPPKKKRLSSDSESALSSPEDLPETKAKTSESETEIPEEEKLPILDQKLRARNKYDASSVFQTLKAKIEQRKGKRRVSEEEPKRPSRRQNGNASEKNNNDDEPEPAERDEDDTAEMTIAKAKNLAAKRKRLLSSSEEDQENGKSDSENKKKKMNSDSEYEQSSGDEKAKESEGEKSEANSDDNSDDDDDDQPKKRKIGSEVDSDEDDEDIELENNRPNEKRRKRIKKVASSDEDADNDKDDKKGGRKNIRKLMKADKLDVSTKEAGKIERDRKQRIEERQKLYNQVYDERPEELKEITKLVLDFDEKSKKSLLEVDKKLVRKLKPHQANGVKFMWDACFESLERCESDSGSGCILAHCMGLGKTLQVITLVHTLLKNSDKTGVNRILVVCPLSTVLNWVNEFNIWLKDIEGREDIYVYDITKLKQNVDRANKLMEWHNDGGIMIISYDMFRNLTNDTAARLRKKVKESLQTSLVDPGPDLVVCDEGHLLKNEKTSLSKAMMKLKTLRRIVLTGTPLQNNLKEYYCMVQFVKPNLLGKYQEYLNRFVNPITNGQYTDSTEYDIQVMRRRAHVLHKMLDGCVQRRDYGVLSPFLPPKHEYVLSLKLSPMQIQLYKYYMKHKSRSNDEANGRKGSILFTDFQNLQRIWTAPLVLRYNSNRYEVEMQRRKDLESEDESEGSIKDFIDDSESAASTSESSSEGGSDEEAGSINSDEPKKSKKKKKNKHVPLPRRTRAKAADFPSDHETEELVAATKKENPTEWWMQICPEDELNNIKHSSKLTLLMSILEECEAIGDKLLVFSQSLYSLDVIEHFLNVIDEQTQKDPLHSSFTGSWTQGQDYFRLDGSTPVESRNAFCKHFNSASNPRARLFLISTRAGGLGINLVAANRVIIFDVSWNPSHDIQSIFRVYRFGQTKPCYVYRFLALGTMEEKIYERQVTKQAISKRVIDEQQIDRHYNSNDLQELYKFDLEQDDERILPILPKDRLFAEMLRKYEDMIYKYHEHDTLLENKEEETLGEEERKQAWEEFEMEKNRPQFVANYVPQQPRSNGPVTSNNIFGIRTDVLLKLLSMKARMDHPTMSDMQVKTSIPLLMQELYRQMDRGELTLYQQLIALSGSLEVPQNYGGQFRVNENLLSQAYSSSMPSTSSYAAQLAYQQQQQATRAQIDRYAMQQRQSLINQLKNRKSPPRVVGSVIEID